MSHVLRWEGCQGAHCRHLSRSSRQTVGGGQSQVKVSSASLEQQSNVGKVNGDKKGEFEGNSKGSSINQMEKNNSNKDSDLDNKYIENNSLLS